MTTSSEAITFTVKLPRTIGVTGIDKVEICHAGVEVGAGHWSETGTDSSARERRNGAPSQVTIIDPNNDEALQL